ISEAVWLSERHEPKDYLSARHALAQSPPPPFGGQSPSLLFAIPVLCRFRSPFPSFWLPSPPAAASSSPPPAFPSPSACARSRKSAPPASPLTTTPAVSPAPKPR